VSHIFSRAVRAGLHPQVGGQQHALLEPCIRYELLYDAQKAVVLSACSYRKRGIGILLHIMSLWQCPGTSYWSVGLSGFNTCLVLPDIQPPYSAATQLR
jgi:hypothetical protein